MAPPRPLVSTIIATRDRPDRILAAVESVLAGSYAPVEVLVVDQSADDRTGARLRRLAADGRVRHLRTATRGLGAAHNVGLAATTGALVAFTDDDCVARADWLEQVVAGFAAYPQAELLFGSVVAPVRYDPLREHCPVYQPARPHLLRGAPGWRAGMGANMSARRVLFERLGGFDEALGPGGPLRGAGDWDLALRAGMSGGPLLAHPAPAVVHAGGVRSPRAAAALWYRDRFGCGALAAKALRAGWYGAAGSLVAPLVSATGWAAWLALRGRSPAGLRKAAYSTTGMVSGFRAGLTWPLDGTGARLRFRASREARAPGA